MISLRPAILALLPLLTACLGLPGGAVELRQEDSGGTVRLEVGETLSVRLQDNSASQYTWRVLEIDPERLRELEEDREGGLVPGSLGWLTMNFRALAPGSSRLRMGQLPPTGVIPVVEFELEVVVEGR